MRGVRARVRADHAEAAPPGRHRSGGRGGPAGPLRLDRPAPRRRPYVKRRRELETFLRREGLVTPWTSCPSTGDETANCDVQGAQVPCQGVRLRSWAASCARCRRITRGPGGRSPPVGDRRNQRGYLPGRLRPTAPPCARCAGACRHGHGGSATVRDGKVGRLREEKRFPRRTPGVAAVSRRRRTTLADLSAGQAGP